LCIKVTGGQEPDQDIQRCGRLGQRLSLLHDHPARLQHCINISVRKYTFGWSPHNPLFCTVQNDKKEY